jgi:heat shock protein HslJ
VRLVVALLVVAATVFAAGCGGGDEGDAADSPGLEGVPWLVTGGIDVEGRQRARPSASFEEGRVTGSTGCNEYGAPYTADGSALEIGELMMTLIGCQGLAGRVETAFVAALERVAAWRVEEQELVLLDADDTDLLRFEAATPVGVWDATGFLRGDALVSPIAGTEITAAFSRGGDLTGSAGCNPYATTYTAEGGALEIAEISVTEIACPDPEGVMEQESAFLDALASATGFRVDGETLQLLRGDGTRVADFTLVTR